MDSSLQKISVSLKPDPLLKAGEPPLKSLSFFHALALSFCHGLSPFFTRLVYFLFHNRLPGLRHFMKWIFFKKYLKGRSDFRELYLRSLTAGEMFVRREKREFPRAEKELGIPSDSRFFAATKIDSEGLVVEAKGIAYTLKTLLGLENAPSRFRESLQALAKKFYGGVILNFYLSPPDYHWFRMPMEGRLKRVIRLSGRLRTVNPAYHFVAAPNFPVVATNERVIFEFGSSTGESFLLIAVGAMGCSGICSELLDFRNGKTGFLDSSYLQKMESYEPEIWEAQDEDKLVRVSLGQALGKANWKSSRVASQTTGEVQLNKMGLGFKKGDELGFFEIGSTVLLLFPDSVGFKLNTQLKPYQQVRAGDLLGEI